MADQRVSMWPNTLAWTTETGKFWPVAGEALRFLIAGAILTGPTASVKGSRLLQHPSKLLDLPVSGMLGSLNDVVDPTVEARPNKPSQEVDLRPTEVRKCDPNNPNESPSDKVEYCGLASALAQVEAA